MSQTNEDIQFLIDLQKELKCQSKYETDCQAAPRFWVVGDYKMSPVPFGFEDEVHINCPNKDYHSEINSLLDELKEEVIDEDSEYTEEAVELFTDIGDDELALEWIQDYYDKDAYLVPVRKDHFIREDTLFLTKQEAKQHILNNKHNYTSEAHTYAMTAWRAPKVERLLSILENFDWEQIKL